MNVEKAIPTLVRVQVLIASVAVAAMAWVAFRIPPLLEAVDVKTAEVKKLTDQRDALAGYLKAQQEKLRVINADISALESDQNAVLETIGQIFRSSEIAIVDKDISFDEVVRAFSALMPGPRKRAVMLAILVAWKNIPFIVGGRQPSSGLDSPGFLKYVLENVGVDIPEIEGFRTSESIMKALSPTNAPMPGDIAMFRGESGFYGLLVLSYQNKPNGKIGVGTLNQNLPLQIRSLDKGNRETRPLVGYFRVDYEGTH